MVDTGDLVQLSNECSSDLKKIHRAGQAGVEIQKFPPSTMNQLYDHGYVCRVPGAPLMARCTPKGLKYLRRYCNVKQGRI